MHGLPTGPWPTRPVDFSHPVGYNGYDTHPGGRMDDILTYIDDHFEETVARLQAFCRQPSIAAQGEGMGGQVKQAYRKRPSL